MESVNLCLFRLSKGRTGGTIFGVPVILLTTSGRRTGARHTKPLLALEDDGSWIVVASRGGTQHDPDWYRNLEAYAAQVDSGGPEAGAVELAPPEVEPAGAAPVAVTAERLQGAERREWWDRLLEVYPRFAAYQAADATHDPRAAAHAHDALINLSISRSSPAAVPGSCTRHRVATSSNS